MAFVSTLAWLALQVAQEEAPAEPPEPPPRAATHEAEESWKFGAYAYRYFLGDDSYLLPMALADRGPLHLEARYNYEARDSLSLWTGRNIKFEGAVELELTPMLGLVLGEEPGFGPGLEADLSWRRFDLSLQCELILDADDPGDGFFFNWVELTYAPTDWLLVGVASQRTRVFDTSGFAEVAPLIDVAAGAVHFTLYAFSPFTEDAYWVFGAGLGF